MEGLHQLPRRRGAWLGAHQRRSVSKRQFSVFISGASEMDLVLLVMNKRVAFPGADLATNKTPYDSV